HLRDMAGSFSRRLHAFCVREAIPLIAAAPGERKHELAQPYLPNDPQFRGLFLVIKGNAPAPVWEVKRNAEGRISDLRHRKTCLCFALSHEDRKRSGFAYQYSVFQLELSRNLLFLRGTTMDEVYQKLIDRTRASLSLEQVKSIFGFSHRPHWRAKRGRERTEVYKAVQAQSYDLTVFKIKWGNLTLKIYDKGSRVLRIEVTVHNAKELRCGRMLDKLPALLERMREMLVRFLATVQAAHVSFLDEGAFERLSEATTRGSRRLAGLDLNKARNRHVADAVVTLSTRPDGFTLAQLAAAVRQRSGQDANTYSARNAAYDVAKLRGKTLLHRIERSRRYAVDPSGVRTLCSYLLLREQVIKPLLAGVVRPRGRPPKVRNPLDQHYVALRQELNRTFETIGLAAA